MRLCRSEQVTLWSNYLELLPGSTLSKPPLQSSYGSLGVCAYIQNIQEEALLKITRTQFQIIFHKDWDMAVLGLSFPLSKLIFAKKYISNKLISAYCVRMCWALFTAKFFFTFQLELRVWACLSYLWHKTESACLLLVFFG